MGVLSPPRFAASSWFFEQVAELASAEPSTRRQFAMIERGAPRGWMPPLHRRDEDEAYRVLDGTVTFFVGADTVTAAAGDVVVAPRGVARSFRVDSETARWLVLTRVGSLERFRDFGRAVSAPLARPADGWPCASELSSVAAIAGANGIELLGPPGALPAAHAHGYCPLS